MLAHVAPRQLILVRGTAEGTAALAEHLRGELASLLTKVHTPAAGQAVELAAEPSYRLALRWVYRSFFEAAAGAVCA